MFAPLVCLVLAQSQPLPFTDVHLADDFWAPRQRVNATATLDHVLAMCESTGRIDNLRRAADPANAGKGGFKGLLFDDSDVFKAVEGAAMIYALSRDKALKKRLDDLADIIIAAQQPDGYLNSYFTLEKPSERWANLKDNHELYCAGHLIEAAIAHHQATGESDLLAVARRLADLIDATFGPAPKRAGVCGHPEIELALLRLWRHTGEQRYLDLARHFIHARGNTALGQRDLFGEYAQDHRPLAEQDQVVGHAVRATYLYAAATEIAAIDDDTPLAAALDRLWDNLTERRMYVTGGIGNSASNEGFTADFDLPNDKAYAETCAAIGLVRWASRMNAARDDARYADIMELALYNAVLSGVAADGKSFCYVNPMRGSGSAPRRDWFSCACCPPNLLRTIAEVGGLVATQRDDAVTLNLYAAGSLRATVGADPVRLDVATAYPWDGTVAVRVRPARAHKFALRLRVPAWAGSPRVESSFGGLKWDLQRGYVTIDRAWSPGDEVSLHFDMAPRVLVADARIADTRGRVALARGPLIYAVESADIPGGLSGLYLNTTRGITARHDAQASRRAVPLTWLEAWGSRAAVAPGDGPYRSITRGDDVFIRALPYFTWGQTAGDMLVWIPASESAAVPVRSGPTLAASHLWHADSLDALTDGLADDAPDTPRATWWPHKGTEEWVRVDFPGEREVAAARVFWFNDAPRGGGCSPPASWRLEYLNGEAWRPCVVRPGEAFGTAASSFNTVHVAPVTTRAVRVVARLAKDRSAGMTELAIDARRP